MAAESSDDDIPMDLLPFQHYKQRRLKTKPRGGIHKLIPHVRVSSLLFDMHARVFGWYRCVRDGT